MSPPSETERRPAPDGPSGPGSRRLLVWTPEGREGFPVGSVELLRAASAPREPELEVVALAPLERPTPERRARRLETLRDDARSAAALVLVAPDALPLEAVAGALAAARPTAVVDGPPPSPPPPFRPGPGAGAPAPSPALGAALARSAAAGLPRLDPRGAPETLARALAALADDPRARPTATLDPDLLAATFALEEQYRRLADWTVDLAEHAADLERGGPSPFRRLRRRVRRFLRKRGLV